MRHITFEEWKQVSSDLHPDLERELNELVAERPGWFQFAVDDDGKAYMALTEQGRREALLEGGMTEYNESRNIH